jgi:hypothetical protein
MFGIFSFGPEDPYLSAVCQRRAFVDLAEMPLCQTRSARRGGERESGCRYEGTRAESLHHI